MLYYDLLSLWWSFSVLSTFARFKNTVESGIIIGKSKHVLTAGSFNLLRLLPSNDTLTKLSAP